MGAFIFFILLIFIVLPIAVLSRLFGGIFRFFRRPSSDSDPFFRAGRQHGYASSDVKKKKKKVFDRNDGEYVEF